MVCFGVACAVAAEQEFESAPVGET